MKIYSKIVVDIETNKVCWVVEALDADLVAQSKGGGKTTSTVTIPPPTQEETEQRLMSNRANQLAMRQQGFKWDGKDFVPMGEEEFSPQERQMREVESLYGAEALRRAKAGFGATDEEKGVINKIYGTSQKRGQENIREFMAELSGSRGMDIKDSSPMAREAARASADLTEGLEGSRAVAELDFGERSRAFGQELRGFQEGLRQRAFDNRMTSSSGFGNAAGQLGQLRGMQKTTKSKGGGGGMDVGGMIGGIGSAVGGIMAF